jgi:hypothetical protein
MQASTILALIFLVSVVFAASCDAWALLAATPG